ncbi:MAG: fused MFS/spermidine synthase [Rickettsiales bacterium]|nr:fused MFS/spermidine synthase [Pseudomonadota bacterium]MDA0966717.1 fused MFS/spermidine synthase [Pseudomonadota bacterium]MDG4544473.1 fused MFS/spermidine synthase [Rickettsiales bacterium]MDG4546625.1 fused MFS/spermidine synthase [Rickettsiales bacterium]MDG4548772.1 fused MFS/spermidine synthase [Rickettsiales bacterium]
MYEKFTKSIFLLTVFIGSFLLFLIQPMMAKSILPLVGGSPSVWISSVALFQCLLLVGYAYSAMGSACLSSKEQSAVQAVLVVVCLATVIPVNLITSQSIENIVPELWVIITLSLSVGLPYFILASNSTLIQRWYHSTFNSSPYYLFAISNTGSVLGLLSYPFLIEWTLTIEKQMELWGGIFKLFAILSFLTYFYVFKSKTTVKKHKTGKSLSKKSAFNIVILGFIPSSLFLSTTLFISIDITPFPLMWIIPLLIYLVSFIVAFTERGKAIINISRLLHPVAFFLMISISIFFKYTIYDNEWHTAKVTLLLIGLFIICLSCHGKVADEKPKPEYLTSYYLWLAVGGAFGGLSNVIAPYIFDSIAEYYPVILLSLYAILDFKKKNKKKYLKKVPFKGVLPLVMITITCLSTVLYLYLQQKEEDYTLLFKERNFFGISKIFKDNENDLIVYKHGNIVHGLQKEKNGIRDTAYTYYRPVFNIVDILPDFFHEKPFGLIGLGGGIFACLGQNGQQLDFFEIDPIVIKIANNPEYFTYTRDCNTRINIIEGDGRIQMEKQPDGKYSIIVVDAFSSDAIPTHLITKEAIEIYLQKLDRENGILFIHISSRYLDYRGVIARIAEEIESKTRYLNFISGSNNEYDYSSDWIILTPKNSKWDRELRGEARSITTKDYHAELWTDNYSNIFSIIGRNKR